MLNHDQEKFPVTGCEFGRCLDGHCGQSSDCEQVKRPRPKCRCRSPTLMPLRARPRVRLHGDERQSICMQLIPSQATPTSNWVNPTHPGKTRGRSRVKQDLSAIVMHFCWTGQSREIDNRSPFVLQAMTWLLQQVDSWQLSQH